MTDRSKRAELSKVKGGERRIFATRFEVRKASAAGHAELEGYATVYGEPYEMWDWAGPYSEQVQHGAAAKTLAEGADFALLLNHTGLTMARTKATTLAASEDTHGLHWRATVNEGRTDVRDMLLAIEDGDVDECSFAFRVTRQTWSPDYMQRTIVEFDLDRGDVSVVNYGANPATSIGDVARASDVLKSLEHLDGDHLLAATRSLATSLSRSGRGLPDDLTEQLRALGLVAPPAVEPPAKRGMTLAEADALGFTRD